MTEAALTVEMAGDALYTALKAAQQAPDLSRTGDGSGDFRTSFIQAFRTLAVYVAEADGQLSPAEHAAIEQIFWLDCADPDATSRANAADPDAIETAIQYLATMVVAVSEADQLFGRATDASANRVSMAADQVFRCVLAADGSAGPDTQRFEAVMARLRPVASAIHTPTPSAGQSIPPTIYNGPGPTSDLAMPAAETGPKPSSGSVPCPARLHDGETCHATTSAVLFQASNVVRRVRYAGLSARVGIVKGLSFRSGSYNVDRTREAQVERIAEGTLCITDQRLIFLSAVKNLDLPFAKMLACETGPGTIGVTRSSSGEILFQEISPDVVELFEQVTGTAPDQRLRLETASARPTRSRHNPGALLLAVALVVGIILIGVLR